MLRGLAGALAVKVTADITQATKQVEEGMVRAGDRAGAKAGSSMGKRLATGVASAFAAVKVGQFLKDSISEASDLGESINAVQKTFQKIPEAANRLRELGEAAATSYGLSQTQFNAFAVQMSSFAQKVAGPGGDVIGTLDEMTTRVADFASVQNLSLEEAASMWRQSLAGETEAAKRFGLDVSKTAVEQYALAAGIIKSGEAMTDQETVMARNALLMKLTSNYAGDFADTSDQLANRTRILSAEYANQKAEVGAALLPTMLALMNILKPLSEKVLPQVADALAAVAPRLTTVFEFIGDHTDTILKMTVAVIALTAGFKAIRIGREVVNDLRSLSKAASTTVPRRRSPRRLPSSGRSTTSRLARRLGSSRRCGPGTSATRPASTRPRRT